MKELPTGLKMATVWLLAGLAVFLGVQAFLSQQRGTRFEIASVCPRRSRISPREGSIRSSAQACASCSLTEWAWPRTWMA